MPYRGWYVVAIILLTRTMTGQLYLFQVRSSSRTSRRCSSAECRCSSWSFASANSRREVQPKSGISVRSSKVRYIGMPMHAVNNKYNSLYGMDRLAISKRWNGYTYIWLNCCFIAIYRFSKPFIINLIIIFYIYSHVCVHCLTRSIARSESG